MGADSGQRPLGGGSACRTRGAGLLAAAIVALGSAGAGAQSLRFHGNGYGAPTLDRVVIALDAPARPVDVGSGDFTLEFWLRALPGENAEAPACSADNDRWILGHILLDRDVDGPGDHGDYGLSLMDRRLAFGLSVGSSGATACGATLVDDGQWHHVAVTRDAGSGQLRMYLDGQPDGSASGPPGNASYRDGRDSNAPYDPTLVIGAEKHDYATLSWAGWLTELRVSGSIRYASPFVRPSARFTSDAATLALYHFDEGMGTLVADSSGAPGGPSHGERRYGGEPAGPEWSQATPFDAIFADGFD